ncbi:MAG: DNA replication and repair protein RecF [Flavobacteriaceae bacterium]|nr:DNA replication and repair protein RecF [Candidatus Neomarinimicrobiota bacterium]MBJ25621.1 DNA replication and repair protein RecF [Flavobacteriaceae bacterium]|tara:strand:- start:5028 stop:6116 length:1089 start_codon:yes stop_codon:yes gene_type:complete
MILKKLSLTNYKSIGAFELDFNSSINCFVGDNGIGKSNIIDSIYHLAFGKSYFNPSANENIKFGTDFFVIQGKFKNLKRIEKIICSFKKGQKKKIKRNQKNYDKISDHIGLIPLVIISPIDQDLILEGSATRRKFIDGVIGQTDKIYLQKILDYNKILTQRNTLLKYFSLNQNFNKGTIEIYNSQLSKLAKPIFEKRLSFLNSFIPLFKECYKKISGSDENVNIIYKSDLKEKSTSDLLKESIDLDRAYKFTTKGIHKDDLEFKIMGQNIKKFGSQGQQKSFLIALKIAQFNFMKNVFNTNPIVLLDDIFDKLDYNRVKKIIKLFKNQKMGQIFISDTDENRIKKVLSPLKNSYKIFNLNSI